MLSCARSMFYLRRYFKLVSILAQTSATLRLGDSVPGNVAQPPFSTNESCFHEFDRLEFDQSGLGLGGMLELIDADRRERCHDRAVGALIRHFHGRAS